MNGRQPGSGNLYSRRRSASRYAYYGGRVIGILGLFFSLTMSVPASAEIVMILHSAKVEVGTETVIGYLVLPYKKDLDVASPEGLAHIRELDFRPGIYESIELTSKFSQDFGQFRFTTKRPRQIDQKKVTKITKLSWPLNGQERAAVALVQPEDARLLKKTPLFWCKGQIWDGDFWLSYNPKVTQEELNNLCNRTFETRPTEEEQKAVLKKGRVVHFTFDTSC